MTLLKAALGLVVSAYVNDTVIRPRHMGRLAREYCDTVRKPLLLVQCIGLTEKLMGAPVRAEVTTDRAYPIRVPNKTFGAVLAVGVLERQRHPGLALREWRRVADRVFVVIPSWMSPHTWLDPTHRWVIDPQLKRAAPLWNGKRHVHLLEVSDRSYGGRPWNQTTTRSKRRPTPRGSPSPSMPSAPQRSRAYTHPLAMPPRTPSPGTPSPSPILDFRTMPSVSSNSELSLTDEFALDFDESW